jgi:molybdopterin converting factor small subunit
MANSVTVSVKLFATLKKYLPPGHEEGVTLTLPAGATVLDAIDALKIPREHAGMLVAGDTYVEKETPLTDGLQLSIFPPLAGGVR